MPLCPCHVPSHSTSVMIQQYGLNIEGVIHIGAHDGIEADIYDYFGAKKVLWFECNTHVYPDLLTRLAGRLNHTAHNMCLWSKDGQELTFYFYRDKKDGASGLYKPDKMFDYIKDCPLLDEQTKVKTVKFDTFQKDTALDLSKFSFLNIDVQGAELEVFRGAQSLLTSGFIKAIWCEVSWDNVYKNAPLLEHIDGYLAKYDYKRIALRQDWEIHGDALYVKENDE